jgi:hypothetical protein
MTVKIDGAIYDTLSFERVGYYIKGFDYEAERRYEDAVRARGGNVEFEELALEDTRFSARYADGRMQR